MVCAAAVLRASTWEVGVGFPGRLQLESVRLKTIIKLINSQYFFIDSSS
jgi:hypothetical protein